jgi:hypothetical protein
MDRLPYRESKFFVKRYCAIILLHMQDRHITPIDDVSHECFDQNSSISASPIIGVSTHGAYLGISDGAQALSRHSNKPAVHSDSEVLAEFVGSMAKRTGLCALDQCQHLGDISGAERDHISSCNRTAKRCPYHLLQGHPRKSLKSSDRYDFSRATQSNFLTRPKQRGEGLKARSGRILDCAERRNFDRIATSPPRPFGKVSMPGGKGDPDRVVENDVCFAQIRKPEDLSGGKVRL